ncbi:type II 3-dehydroquinate dehydratase [Porphyromonas sp. COT-108 OH1349]|uniref:type II 3-dehydroquinate dehydratase n=1 Tax=Porphyromonas sp. COT-108 OH1349 TaxID=1537504 RepID=UPI00052B8FF1|nr:type II 3-dehydroquinate dehydratase [Porphyromonas sp. COT-108 OH1349]KGN68462.1 3-dehydroquinate dehydratase [Porphyromonas sp. COT-108 OH1349]
MKIIHIINGPNLNLLGEREPEIYGSTDFEEYLEKLRDIYHNVDIRYFQSNHEGEIIDYLHDIRSLSGGIVLNPGALTHYSYALRDAIAAISVSVVEVHISNLYKREEFRQKSVTAAEAAGILSGFGLDGYRLAIAHLLSRRNG